ncbi:MAG TPA: DUF1841 family protein [Steroidobacteraceae bacterium]|nr:DUF1841 family protein [Steroidobacteraceae bacterium]
MFFANTGRDELRRRYVEAWRRRREALPLEPLDAQIADIIALHPEYHALLEAPDASAQDFSVEQGRSNPFLHMGLHLAIREQLATRRPPGIELVHARLASTLGDVHAAEHRMIEVLAEALWEAQRAGRAPDEQRYLERLRSL